MKMSWRRRVLPPTLSDPTFIAIKAGIAVSLTAAFSMYLADNPDLVSACFIAVVSISPTPLMGLKLTVGQLFNSGIGALWGVLMRAMGVPLVYGVGIAVGLSIFSSFVARQSNFWISSAFSAYFVQVIPYGGIGHTLQIRMLALSVGGVCALAVNVVVFFIFTKYILWRRLRIVLDMVVQVLSIKNTAMEVGDVVVEGAQSREHYFQRLDDLSAAAQPVFAVLNTLLFELSSVSLESRAVRRNIHWMDHYTFRVSKLKQILHLAVQMGYEVQKAREELPQDSHLTLFLTTSAFLENLCTELGNVDIGKAVKVGEGTEMQPYETWEGRVAAFPTEHIRRVAKDLGSLVEDIKFGAPSSPVKVEHGKPLLKEGDATSIEK